MSKVFNEYLTRGTELPENLCECPVFVSCFDDLCVTCQEEIDVLNLPWRELNMKQRTALIRQALVEDPELVKRVSKMMDALDD